VYRLKREFPQLTIVINGGIVAVDFAQEHLQHVDGVMLGRAAYHDPYVLARVEHALFGVPLPERAEVLERLAPYVAAQIRAGEAMHHIARHVLGLFLGEPGARAFRRYLSEHMRAAGADFGVLRGALAALHEHAQVRAA
jgi:tRNA-dihydrouridine synthase A